jgi:small subunit ribosomal protein S1
MPKSDLTESSASGQTNESFGDILSQFEQIHTAKRAEGSREGTVISTSADSVFLDIGFKPKASCP